ncbi:hypothetical protein ACMV8I_19820 [Ewingella sp. S1.OA.A_B6]
MEPSIKDAMSLVRQISGPLSPHLETYISSLIEKQYSVIRVKTKAWYAAAFDTWLSERSILLKELADMHKWSKLPPERQDAHYDHATRRENRSISSRRFTFKIPQRIMIMEVVLRSIQDEYLSLPRLLQRFSFSAYCGV